MPGQSICNYSIQGAVYAFYDVGYCRGGTPYWTTYSWEGHPLWDNLQLGEGHPLWDALHSKPRLAKFYSSYELAWQVGSFWGSSTLFAKLCDPEGGTIFFHACKLFVAISGGNFFVIFPYKARYKINICRVVFVSAHKEEGLGFKLRKFVENTWISGSSHFPD